MIRKNINLCKLFHKNITSKYIFLLNDYGSLGCPNCGCKDDCKYHCSYDRYFIDINHGERVVHRVLTNRVECSSCYKTHAIIPGAYIPYGSYSVRFVFHVLQAYALRTTSVESICNKYCISVSTLYRWIKTFKSIAPLLVEAINIPRALNLLVYIPKPSELSVRFHKTYGFPLMQNAHTRQRMLLE